MSDIGEEIWNCTTSEDATCYNTNIDASQIVWGMLINLGIGLACYVGFVLWRSRFRIYFNRLVTPQLTASQRPPALKLGGHWQLWSWLIPVFTVSDGALLQSAGLDALIAQRILGFGCLALLPLTVLGVAVLLPVNYTSYQPATPDGQNATSINDEFLKMTMSAIPSGSSVLWVHFFFTYIFIGWVCFLIVSYYKEFISLRQAHDQKLMESTEIGRRTSLLEDSAPTAATGAFSMAAYSTGQLAKRLALGMASQTAGSASGGSAAADAVGGAGSGGSGGLDMAGSGNGSGSKQLSVRFNDGMAPGQEGAGATPQPLLPTSRLALQSASGSGTGSGKQASRSTVELAPRSQSMQPAAKAPWQGSGAADSPGAADAGLRQRYGSNHHEERSLQHKESSSSCSVPAAVAAAQGQQADRGAAAAAPAAAAAGGLPQAAGQQRKHKESDSGGPQPDSLAHQGASSLSDETAGLSAWHSGLQHSPFDVDVERAEHSWRQAGDRAGWDELAEPLPLVHSADAAQFYTVLVVDEAIEEFEYRHIDSPWIWHLPSKVAATPRKGRQALDALVTEGKAFARLTSKKQREYLDHCHRRMQMAETTYRGMFGVDFDRIIPVSDCRQVDALLARWHTKRLQLDRLRLQHQQLAEQQAKVAEAAAADAGEAVTQVEGIGGDSGTDTAASAAAAADKAAAKAAARAAKQQKQGEQLEGRLVKVAQQVEEAEQKLAELQQQIEDGQAEAEEALPAPCFFVTFRTAAAAAYAARLNLNPQHERMMRALPAPAPRNVNYPALLRSWVGRSTRPVVVSIFVLAMLLFPIGTFAGICGTIVSSVCGRDPNGTLSANGSWFCSDATFAGLLRNLITGLLPSLLLSIWQAVVLPIWFYSCAQAEAQHFSFTALDLRCAHWFFLHDLFNVFLGGMLGGSIVWGLRAVINDPSQFFNILGDAVPASSNFFINYVSYKALAMAPFRLFYPHAAVFGSILKWLHLLPRPQTERDKEAETPPRNCRYSRDLGVLQLTVFVIVLGYAVVTPLILPFGLVYFVMTWPVWRYQMLYVYQGQYDNGGQFWVYTAHRVVICLGVMASFTAAILGVKGAYTQGLVLLITAVVFLWWFDRYLTYRYDAVVDQPPARDIQRAPRARVDDRLYMAPPMRPRAAGWYPEWGKAWLGYGVPRYGL